MITHTFTGLTNNKTYYAKVFTVNNKKRVNNRADLPVANAIPSEYLLPDITYTGTYEIVGDNKKGYMIIKSSGEMIFNNDFNGDVWMLGGGATGNTGYNSTKICGNGGGGGYTNTFKDISFKKSSPYNITIGAGGGKTGVKPQNGGNTVINGLDVDISVNGGSFNGTGGSAGGKGYNGNTNEQGSVGASDGASSAQAAGQGTTTKPFAADMEEFASMPAYGAGGGGGHTDVGYMGGEYGGGQGGGGSYIGGRDAIENTGSGGGGGGVRPASSGSSYSGGKGADGLIIIRWGY